MGDFLFVAFKIFLLLDWISPSTTLSIRAHRKTSVDTFNKKSPSNEIIGALKYFSNVVAARDGQSADKPAYSWGSVRKFVF